jgi:hypothetical protein
MLSSRNKLYLLILTVCSAGYIWLLWQRKAETAPTLFHAGCLIKQTTGVPCPSCGTTRGILALSNAEFYQAVNYNPLALPIAVFMLLLPLWILRDGICRSNSLQQSYRKAERAIRRPALAILLITLVGLNWVWNIYKGI